MMEFSSGRPYAGLLGPACCNAGDDNLNDTAFNPEHCEHRRGDQWRWPYAGNRPEFFLRPVAGEDRPWAGPQF